MRNFNPGISLERSNTVYVTEKVKKKPTNTERDNHFFNILTEVNWKTDLLNLQELVSESTFYIKEK